MSDARDGVRPRLRIQPAWSAALGSAFVEHTYQCWRCGGRVHQDDVVRINVRSGLWGFRRVNVCRPCALTMRRAARIRRALVGAVIVAAIAVPLIVNNATNPNGLKSHPLGTCSPTPCAFDQGVLMHVTRVVPDYPTTGATLSPQDGIGHGFHVVKVVVTLTAQREMTFSGYQYNFFIRDALGQWHSFGEWYEGDWPVSQCQTDLPDKPLASGVTIGPLNLCFRAAGPVQAPVVLGYTDQEYSGSCPPANLGSAVVGLTTGERIDSGSCSMVLVKL